MIPKREERNAALAGEIAQLAIIGNAYSDAGMQARCHEIAADDTVAMDVRAMAIRKLDESMGLEPSDAKDRELVKEYLAGCEQ